MANGLWVLRALPWECPVCRSPTVDAVRLVGGQLVGRCTGTDCAGAVRVAAPAAAPYHVVAAAAALHLACKAAAEDVAVCEDAGSAPCLSDAAIKQLRAALAQVDVNAKYVAGR